MGPVELLVLVLLGFCTFVNGHGNLVFPYAWWDKNQVGWYWDENGADTHVGCGALDLPDDTEFSAAHNGTLKHDCMKYWFTLRTMIPGHPTIPDYMSQKDILCRGQDVSTHPWSAPGTAPVHGSCGTLGANPNGCHDDGKGKFGDCCGEDNCNSFAFGKNAEEYLWENAPVTEWQAGSYQEVAWYVSGANHAGGYSYRLCKLPAGGITELTEECFQENTLEFAGDQQWVTYKMDKYTGHRTEITALQTTEGTYPAGSMWRTNPIVPGWEEGSKPGYASGHIVDNVIVPDYLEPGEYVLSFRWDSKCTTQVWTACANIRIVM